MGVDHAGHDDAASGVDLLGASVHVASTAWFYTVPEIRRYAGAHKARYIYVPVVRIASGAIVAAALPPEPVRWASLGFYGWQFWHFQKQNLGLAALAATATGTARLSRRERAAIVAAGVFGVAALIVRRAGTRPGSASSDHHPTQ
ncbi:hypothetical protein KGQ19_07325 [Catenulispora sp. NL8]|uniref:Uncharacterized protein n=1 Tax=Catenulispora pinistramenti TaxID=2705254 RepID=A0ABS5KKW6_9ACTN|nr:hypothetical protein [Catenulispora pinistramenti]MBS2546675.1 hypothetical protein [Catenulispora pinistramenti]